MIQNFVQQKDRFWQSHGCCLQKVNCFSVGNTKLDKPMKNYNVSISLLISDESNKFIVW